MLRLAHRIVSQDLKAGDGSDEKELLQKYSEDRDLLMESHILIADNVAGYYDSQLDSKSFKASDFPSCVPQFSEMFVEHTGIWHTQNGIPYRQFLQLGALVSSFFSTDSDADEHITQSRCNGWEIDKDDVFCMCHARIYVSFSNGHVGYLGETAWVVEKTMKTNERCYDPAGNGVPTAAFPAMMAISLMNCKNVIKQDATETEGPADKWLRRMKQPKLRYHVLNIEPMKQVLRTEGGVEHNGLKKALHICRGHFATYTDDKPLFGRVTGTFWKPAHVRGSIEQGAVVKDYSVKAPITGETK